MEASSSDLQTAVERQHDCKATFRKTETVWESFQGKIAWEGVVSQFDIEGHPDTDTCYAWSSAVEGSNKCRLYAVLKIPPVDSPQAAIRAAIVADHKADRSI